SDANGDRERQDGARMRLDDHGIAGGQIPEHRRIGVACRQRATAEREADAARHRTEVLLHADRLTLALRLFPEGCARNPAQLVPCGGEGFETAVLRMSSAR